MALHDRLNMIISTTVVKVGKRASDNGQFLALNLLTDFLAGIGQLLAETRGRDANMPNAEVRRLADA